MNKYLLQEFRGIMSTRFPSIGLSAMFNRGTLQIVLPELCALACNDRNHKDNFAHSLKVLDNMAQKSRNYELRLAALLHDIGKSETKRNENGKVTFHNHDIVGAKMIPAICNRLGIPQSSTKKIQFLVANHMRPMEISGSNVSAHAVRKLRIESSKYENDLYLLCTCDVTTINKSLRIDILQGLENLKQKSEQVRKMDARDGFKLNLSGSTIIAEFGCDGKRCKQMKDFAKKQVLRGKWANDESTIIAYLHRKYDK